MLTQMEEYKFDCTGTRLSGTRLTPITCGPPTSGSMNFRRWNRDSCLTIWWFTPMAALTEPTYKTSSRGATSLNS